MNLQEIKESVNLIEYARDFHGLTCNREGKAHCPFHKPDKNPSFVISFDGGIWKWIDFHDNRGGTIIEFEAKFSNCSEKKAIATLLSRFKDKTADTPKAEIPTKVIETIPYLYKDADGTVILKKEKRVFSDGSKTYSWQNKVNDRWSFTKGEYSFVPYNLDKFKDYQQVIVAEGEKDADTINKLDIGEFATTAPNGAASWPDEITPYFKDFKKITFLYDVGAEAAAAKHAAKLKESYPKTEICIASVPMNKKNADITDYLETCDDKPSALLDILAKEKPVAEPTALSLLCFEDIVEQEIKWHIPGVYACGMIHSLGGVQGHGKSLHLIDLSARTSSGMLWPITGTPVPKGDVLYITDEDSRDKIIKPRLRVAGADMSRVFIPDFNIESLVLPDHEKKLEMWLGKLKNPRLLLLDPLVDYSSGNLNPSEGATKIIKPLKSLAERTGVCLIYTVHFNKNVNLDSVHRVAHSYVLTSKPRLAWLIIKQDPNDDLNPHRLFCCGKTAFKPISNMMFTIKGDEFDTPYIDNWRTAKTHTADALATSERRRDLKVEEAEIFLMKHLDGQSLFVEDIKKLAEKESIHERNLYRAKNNLPISDDYDNEGRKFWTFDKSVKPKRMK